MLRPYKLIEQIVFNAITCDGTQELLQIAFPSQSSADLSLPCSNVLALPGPSR
jgi:hypothetical protein